MVGYWKVEYWERMGEVEALGGLNNVRKLKKLRHHS